MGDGDYVVIRANDPVVVPPGGKSTGYRPRRVRGGSENSSNASMPTILTFGATGEHARVEENGLRLLNQFVKLDDLPFDEPHNYTNACMAVLLAYGVLKEKRQITSPVRSLHLGAKSHSLTQRLAKVASRQFLRCSTGPDAAPPDKSGSSTSGAESGPKPCPGLKPWAGR